MSISGFLELLCIKDELSGVQGEKLGTWGHGVHKLTLKWVSVSGPIAVTRALLLQSSARGESGCRNKVGRCQACEGDQFQRELVEILQLVGQRGVGHSPSALRHGPTTQPGVLQSISLSLSPCRCQRGAVPALPGLGFGLLQPLRLPAETRTPLPAGHGHPLPAALEDGDAGDQGLGPGALCQAVFLLGFCCGR